MISFQHVSKTYRTVIGVNDLDIEMPLGSYGLVGPNGSGKTTLINLLTGGLKPSIGKVRIFGCDPWSDRSVLKRIGLCPSSDVLYANVTGFQWVQYLTVLSGFSRKDAAQRARQCLQRVGMGDSMDRPMGTYSLGMRQRTKLAQAITHDPELLILDEPFNGVDPIGRFEIGNLLKEWTAHGRSLILASHILHEVEAVTKSFLLIHAGRLLASGKASEIQPMLVDIPQEVRLRGDGLAEVAKRIAAENWLVSLRFSPDRGDMFVAVKEPRALYRSLVELSRVAPINITGVHSPDGNLTAAFDALLKVHRGETA